MIFWTKVLRKFGLSGEVLIKSGVYPNSGLNFIMSIKKKKNLLQHILKKRILSQESSLARAAKAKLSSEKWGTHIEIVFNVTAGKSFVFVSRFTQKNLSYFDVVIFWIGGEKCIVKNEKFIVFPESGYFYSSILFTPDKHKNKLRRESYSFMFTRLKKQNICFFVRNTFVSNAKLRFD